MKKLLLSIICIIVLSVFKMNATTYYLRTTATSCTVLASWTTDPTGLTAAGTPTIFTGAHDWNIQNVTSISLINQWGISNTSTVNIGNGSTAITFSLTGSGKIGSAAAAPSINILNNSTFVMNKNTNISDAQTNFMTGSTMVYTSLSTSTGIITDTYYNLNIIASNSLRGNVNVNGALTISAGQTFNIDTSPFILTLNGSIANSGSLSGGASSLLVLQGTGNMGTLNFTPGFESLGALDVNLANSASSITLGTNLTIDGAFDLTQGLLNINAKTFTTTTATALNFVAGMFVGSPSTSLFLGTNAVTGSLLMDPANKRLLTLVYDDGGAGATLTLGNALDILDSVKVYAGTLDCAGFLKLKSTAALKARIAEIGGTVTGNITVETFIPGTTAGWRNLGPSGVSGLTVSNWDGGSGSATGFAMTCSGCINDAISAGGYFVSIQSDPAGNGTYTELISTDALTPGTGYWVYDGSSPTAAINITQTTSGPVVTGSIPSGTGFMSNPYPSPISVDRLKTHTSITQVDLYNENTGTYTSYNGGIPSNAVIPMGQGFYASGATNITFQESDKVSYNTASFSILKTATSSSIGTVFQLNVAGASSGDFDQTYIRFHGNATPSFDNDLDAYKRFATPGYLGYPGAYSQYTTINTLASNMDYAINSLPYATTSNVVIPVRVKVSITGTYSIMPIGVANFPATACITLKDKLLNITHDLITGNYVCSINDTTSAARFELTICADITTGINNAIVNIDNTIINQDLNGAYVKTSFETNTKATISAYNVMGQKLMADKEIEGKDLTTYLDLGDVHSQVVIIRVTTSKTNTTKKIFIN